MSDIHKKTERRVGNVKLVASVGVTILNKSVQAAPTENVSFK